MASTTLTSLVIKLLNDNFLGAIYTKFHRAGCSYLKMGPEKLKPEMRISLRVAQKRGTTATGGLPNAPATARGGKRPPNPPVARPPSKQPRS